MDNLMMFLCKLHDKQECHTISHWVRKLLIKLAINTLDAYYLMQKPI